MCGRGWAKACDEPAWVRDRGAVATTGAMVRGTAERASSACRLKSAKAAVRSTTRSERGRSSRFHRSARMLCPRMRSRRSSRLSDDGDVSARPARRSSGNRVRTRRSLVNEPDESGCLQSSNFPSRPSTQSDHWHKGDLRLFRLHARRPDDRASARCRRSVTEPYLDRWRVAPNNRIGQGFSRIQKTSSNACQQAGDQVIRGVPSGSLVTDSVGCLGARRLPNGDDRYR